MRQLLLLRHAKSSWDDAAQPDHARPLNARGRAAAAAMRTTLRSLGLVPDVVLVSSARRTLQTLDALAPWDETPIIEPMDQLYLATPAQMLRIVARVSETVRSLMIVGHNPGIHDLALGLAGGHGASSNGNTGTGNIGRQLADGFPTGALAEFTIAGPWQDLAALGEDEDRQSAGRLVRFICPKDVTE